MRYQSPPEMYGINIGGEQFNADSSGCINLPEGNYASLLLPLGFMQKAEKIPACIHFARGI